MIFIRFQNGISEITQRSHTHLTWTFQNNFRSIFGLNDFAEIFSAWNWRSNICLLIIILSFWNTPKTCDLIALLRKSLARFVPSIERLLVV